MMSNHRSSSTSSWRASTCSRKLHPIEYASMRRSESTAPGVRARIRPAATGTGISPPGGCRHGGTDGLGPSGDVSSGAAPKNAIPSVHSADSFASTARPFALA